jgi:hypothetical protein
MTISLRDTREHMQAVQAQAAKVRELAIPAAGPTPSNLETHEVTMYA